LTLKVDKHPAFVRAERLTGPLRAHFPKSTEEAQDWQPMHRIYALAGRVLAVAQTRVTCEWAAYCDAVLGHDHSEEYLDVLRLGSKLPEATARTLFPEFDEVRYAE
jgi:hypothetical protein